jgi:hypothetical protein
MSVCRMHLVDVAKGNKFIVSCMNFDGGNHRGRQARDRGGEVKGGRSKKERGRRGGGTAAPPVRAARAAFSQAT